MALPGTFTPWQPLPENTDVLFYEGLHGGVVTQQHNVAEHVDLLVGVVPIVNLEWIQKLVRDTSERGHSRHRYTRPEMDMAIRKARDLGRHISYFGPDANDFGLLEQTFRRYGESGIGESRKYLHTYDEAVPWNQVADALPDNSW
ncbi:hypothetical protein CRX72_27385 [Pantoea sp. BRM17]|nr:hypothetical protein CRX72_27385 [Pantoea sp. BRM17]